MPFTFTTKEYAFLQGGGEMGALTRNFNWAETSLGMPNEWPQSLRTTLGIVLHSAFPMFLFWGADLLCFYNDAYRPSLGMNGKHPAIGKKAKEVWPEIWEFIGPLIDKVLATNEPVWFEDQFLPIYRNGHLEDVYWTFSYSPTYGDDGQVSGVLVTCTETTEKVATAKKLNASEQYFRQLTNTIPAIIWETRPDGYCTYLNKQWYDLTGQTPAEAEGFGWLNTTHPDDQHEAGRLFMEANQKQAPFNALYRLRQKDGSYRWVIDQGSPRFNAAGEYEGMIGTVVDVHDQKLAEEEITRFKYMAENASDPFILMRADGTFAYLNKLALDRWGYTAEEATHLHVPDVDPLYNTDAFSAAFVRAQIEKIPPFETIHQKKDGTRYPVEVNMGGLMLGHQPHMFAVARNITERKQAEEALRESEQRFQAAIAAVQGILWTNNARGEMEGEQPGWAALTGQRYEDYQGYGWSKAVHPDDAQATVHAWNEAVQQRRMFVFEHRVRVKTGRWELFSIRAIPLTNADGSIREWVGVHTNITEQRQAELTLAESEQFSRSIFNDSPIANLVFVGQDMVIKTINVNMLQMLGRDVSIIGKPFMEAIPELITTPLMNRLRHVLATGETYYQPEEKIELVRYGQPHSGYYNYIYKALKNTAGERYGVICTATEVTELVLARQRVETAKTDLSQATQRLGLALDAGRFGSYELELATGLMNCTAQCKINYGQAPEVTFNFADLMRIIVADDRPAVEQAIAHALTSQSTYRAEYRIIWPDGTLHWIKASGMPTYAGGQAVMIIGITQDITAQRMAQEELEQQVELRTQQLQASIQDLQRSNENLQQFAYIASHDLQEPLRKIQSFGDLLSNQYAEQLGEGIDHLKRMQAAASRMSILIKDLLAFSRISTRQDATASVSLTEIAQTVLNDLELTINETNAQIDVGPLPTVLGDKSQLGQLFQNLLSNALKFRRTDGAGIPISPVVRLSAQPIAASDLPHSVRPTRRTKTYHCIVVSDNGIGFDEKYVDRIFQVFQRLHSRNEFAGTGIGLAICQKVAANHGGAITATSQLGEGSIFSVYLPIPEPL